jgi:hypothetical protein
MGFKRLSFLTFVPFKAYHLRAGLSITFALKMPEARYVPALGVT